MRQTFLYAVTLALVGCSPGPFECPNEPATPVPDVATVCSHIESIGCFIDPDPDAADAGIAPSCEVGYEEVRVALPTDEFERVLRCYMRATECEQLEGCNQACGPGGGHISYRPGVDAGASDAGPDDGGAEDAGSVDAGGADAGSDAGFDAGGEDDAGPDDAGPMDAGSDAGLTDAGSDAGTDAGFDAGTDAG